MELKGKTAVITGSSGRLGQDIAKALGAAGCNCICHYNRNRQRAEELAEEIQGMGVKAAAVKADLAEPCQIDGLFEEAERFGRCQVLINSAAVFSRQSLADVSFEEAQRVLNVNLTASILASKAFAKVISAEFGTGDKVIGKIINIADVGGVRPWAGYVLYCASKSGLIGATKSIAKELAPAVCVNSIAVGVVSWPSEFDEAEKKRQLSFIPAGRIGQMGEITGAIIFLLESDYITGQTLIVDGGRCI